MAEFKKGCGVGDPAQRDCTGHLQHRPEGAVHQSGVHRVGAGVGRTVLDERQRAFPGQHAHQAPVVFAEVRGCVPLRDIGYGFEPERVVANWMRFCNYDRQHWSMGSRTLVEVCGRDLAEAE